jgi:hypothetical protein
MWPLVHTAASRGFKQVLETKPDPSLLSRRRRNNVRDDRNDDWVFTYAAPRLKPGHQEPVVLVLRPCSAGTREMAHPFDSGGLRKHPKKPVALAISLEFGSTWRETLALFVDALFDDPNHYLEGRQPVRPDPAGILQGLAGSALPYDCLFFTWEVKTWDEIPLGRRLAWVLVGRDPQGRLRLDQASYLELFRRWRKGEYELRLADSPDDLQRQLAEAFRLTTT